MSLPGSTRWLRAARPVTRAWWAWRFSRFCSRVGSGLEVMGPCFLENQGRVTVGNGLSVRSRAHNRVEISVAAGADLRVGDRVFINQGVRIACSNRVDIGPGCFLGDEVVILDADYHPAGGVVSKTTAVCLENDVWLATRVIVLRGVTIGRGSVVGAGSVVTRSIPPNSFAAGVPARVVRSVEPR